MVKTDDMMSVEDVKNILGIELLGVVPDSEKIIVASNRGEPIVLEAKLVYRDKRLKILLDV